MIGNCMEVGPFHAQREIPLYHNFFRVAVTLIKHNIPSNPHSNSPQASQLIQNMPLSL